MRFCSMLFRLAVVLPVILILPALGLAPAAEAAGPIASGEVASGTFASPTYSETWTFSGTTGNRVLIAAVTTSGVANTVIRLKNPGGTEVVSTASDRVEHQLQATGTYTLIVEDLGLNDAGTYNVSLLNVTSGPLTSGSDPDGGAIASAEVKTGQTQAVCDFDAFTFNGTAGDRILFTALATTGSPYNTSIAIYPPGGGAPEVNNGANDRLDLALGSTGTYTVVVEDTGNNDTGNYSVSLLNLTAGPLTSGSDPDGGTIVSADVKSGTFTSAPDFDAWKFTATAGDRVLLAVVNTSAGTQNTMTYLYPPSGGAVVSTASDRNELQLAATGTYTVVVEELGQNEVGGTYNVSLLNVTSGPLASGTDPDGGAIASAEVGAGQTQAAGDFDAFTLIGTAGDRVLFTAVATAGAPYNTTLTLYPPGGGPPETSTGSSDRLDWALEATGTYSVVVEDAGNNDTGSYSVSLLNVTAGPLTSGSDPDGGTIASAEVKSAAFTSVPDFDAWKFTGTAGDRVILTAVNTSAGTQNTQTRLYPPTGAPIVGTAADRNECQLPVTGTYTIVVEEFGQDEAGGTFNVSLLNVTSGPLSNGADPDGGAIGSAENHTGQTNIAGDLDAFTFTANAGERVLICGLATSGATYNTMPSLYPPGGGAAESNPGSGDRIDWKLEATGVYTLVIEDAGDNDTGGYSLSYLNMTAGPLTSGTDPDGGYLVDGQSLAGSVWPAPDFDAWKFTGAVGDTVHVSAVATSGPINTLIAIYPPNGGAAVVSTASDNVTYILTSNDTYTVVISDLGDDQTGTYNLTYQGPSDLSGVPEDDAFDHTQVVVLSPYPNPFTRTATMAFSLPTDLPVRIRVFDATGAKVRTIANQTLSAGRHSYDWDGRDDHGRQTTNGIYYLETVTGEQTARQKLVRVQ